MKTDTIAQVLAILDQLSESYRKQFQHKLLRLRIPENDPFDQPNHQVIDEAFSLLEANAENLISEAAIKTLAVSNEPEVFSVLNKVISAYLRKIGDDLAVKISQIQRATPKSIWEGQRADEFRKRMERLLDSYRPALVVEIETAKKPSGSKRGRKPKYDWLAATNEVWGQIYRKELQPKNQADIERALEEAATYGKGFEMGDNTSRPFARPIWREMGNEPED